MKKIKGKTPSESILETIFFYHFISCVALLVAIVGIGGTILYDQNKKIEIAEKCSEIMKYRNDVKLHNNYFWTCTLSGKDVDIDTLDFLIKLYKVRAVENKK